MSTGTIYLLCFERPYGHARHYLGWTVRELEERLAEHRAGRGARLMEVVAQAGIGFELVRTWVGNRRLERRLKKEGSGVRLCPRCSPHRTWGTFTIKRRRARTCSS